MVEDTYGIVLVHWIGIGGYIQYGMSYSSALPRKEQGSIVSTEGERIVRLVWYGGGATLHTTFYFTDFG